MTFTKNIALALGGLTLLFSCNEQDSLVKNEEVKSSVTTQAINAQDILPFQYTIQTVGFPENFRFKIEVSEGEVVVKMLGESQTFHSSSIPLKIGDLQEALSALEKSDFESTDALNTNNPTKGVIESLESSLGNRTFYRDEMATDQLLPTSAASFLALSDLAASWSKVASEEFKEKVIARATIDQKIVHEIGEFVEVGMTRETVLKKYPNPNRETDTSINYVDWRPDLVSNATRKGTYGITLRLENGKVASWSWSSQN